MNDNNINEYMVSVSYSHKNKGKFIMILLIMASVIVSILSSIISIIDGYQFSVMAILPMCYAVCVVVLYLLNKSITTNFVKMVILCVYSIRMVIYPLTAIVSLNDMRQINSYIFDNVNIATIIQCYEFIFVTVFLILIGRKDRVQKHISIHEDMKFTKVIRYVAIVLLLLIGFIIVVYPSLIFIYRPIFFLNKSDYFTWKNNFIMIKNSVPMIIYYISVWTMIVLRIIMVYIIIIYLKKLSKKSRREWFYLLISLIVISTLVLITTEDRAGSIYMAFVLLLMMGKLYPRYSNFICFKIPLVIGIFIFIGFSILPIITSEKVNILSKLSIQLNAYFSGSINLAAALEMPKNDVSLFFLGDFCRSIPLIKGFFSNLDTTTMLFNKTLGLDPIYNSQIIPCVGQSAFYLGYIGAPFFSIILIVLAIRCNKKAMQSKETFGYVCYRGASIFFSVGPVFYDFFLTFTLVIQYIIPLIVIHKLFCMRRIKKTKETSDFVLK